jgi:hypothetical protein
MKEIVKVVNNLINKINLDSDYRKLSKTELLVMLKETLITEHRYKVLPIKLNDNMLCIKIKDNIYIQINFLVKGCSYILKILGFYKYKTIKGKSKIQEEIAKVLHLTNKALKNDNSLKDDTKSDVIEPLIRNALLKYKGNLVIKFNYTRIRNKLINITILDGDEITIIEILKAYCRNPKYTILNIISEIKI